MKTIEDKHLLNEDEKLTTSQGNEDFIPIRLPSRIIQLEVEKMSLDSYLVEGNSLASGGELISLFGAPENTGTASAEFVSGSPGLYDIVVGYFDESDGEAQLELQVDGVSVDSWVLDQDLGGDVPDEQTFTEHTISGVKLDYGDTLTIQGTLDGGEFARVDFIRLIPQVGERLGEEQSDVVGEPLPSGFTTQSESVASAI